jgi:hypothetical protein
MSRKPNPLADKCLDSHAGHVCFGKPDDAHQMHKCFCGVEFPRVHAYMDMGLGLCAWCQEQPDHPFHGVQQAGDEAA